MVLTGERPLKQRLFLISIIPIGVFILFPFLILFTFIGLFFITGILSVKQKTQDSGLIGGLFTAMSFIGIIQISAFKTEFTTMFYKLLHLSPLF